MQRGVDVAIVGGGVMGCGLAFCLAGHGLRVAIVERSHVAAEATGAAAGILSAQAEASAPGPFLELALRSRALFPSWAAALRDETGLDIGYAASGVLMVATTAADVATLQQRAAWQRAQQLNAEWLDAATLKNAEPALSPAAGALRLPDDGHIDPRRLCAALWQAAEKRGATLLHATVKRIEAHAGQVSGLALSPHDAGAPNQLAAARVVLCAGSWTSTIAGSPLRESAVQPVHGQIVELEAGAPLFSHVVFGSCAANDLHGYLVPRSDGRILIGATMERTGFTKRVTVSGVHNLLTLGSALLPRLGAATFRTAWAGLRPSTVDGLPLLGATTLPGLYVCSGHFRNGVLLAPASCEAMSALLGVAPTPSAVELAPFAPARLDNRPT